MTECFCSIFNTREERVVEESGRVIRRMICNVCGRVLDCKEERLEGDDEKRSFPKRQEKQEEGLSDKGEKGSAVSFES